MNNVTTCSWQELPCFFFQVILFLCFRLIRPDEGLKLQTSALLFSPWWKFDSYQLVWNKILVLCSWRFSRFSYSAPERAVVVSCREHLPPTNVARVWFPDSSLLVLFPEVCFSEVPRLFGRISGDIILFVSSKWMRLEARNFSVIFIFIPFTTYKKTSFTD